MCRTWGIAIPPHGRRVLLGGWQSCFGSSSGIGLVEGPDGLALLGGKDVGVEDKAPIPSMGWFAVCKDTEGNKIGLYKDDPTATM